MHSNDIRNSIFEFLYLFPERVTVVNYVILCGRLKRSTTMLRMLHQLSGKAGQVTSLKTEFFSCVVGSHAR